MSIAEIIKDQVERPDQIVMVLFFTVFILGELIVSSFRTARVYNTKDTVNNLFMGLLTFVSIASVKGGVYLLFELLYQHRFFSFSKIEIGNAIVYWGLLLLINDFMFYAFHWMAHRIRFFWALHVAHHNSEEYNFTVSIRGLFLLQLFKFPLWGVMPLFGFEPIDVFFMDSLVYFYQFWVHTKLIGRLGFLEGFLQTPVNHSVHHSEKPELLNKNLGGVFIIWDRIFGTYYRTNEKIKFGIPNNINSQNPWIIMMHEFVCIWREVKQPDLSLWQRFKIVFGDLPFNKY
jgi:sterol desaturase/sphingolipid hydroxylase (fatty acid hydroxylase superfamily)